MWDVLLATVAVLVFGLFIHSFSRHDVDRRVVARLAEMERKLDAISQHLGIDPLAPDVPDMPDVVEFLRRGQKIQAIKAFRERTGATLKEAKDACDRMARELGL